MTFAGLRRSCSSVGSAYCHGCTCCGGGTRRQVRAFDWRGRPWTTSGSSGVPRPVGRSAGAAAAPPPARRRRRRRPPRPPPPTVALTVKVVAAVAVHREVVGHAVDDRARVVHELRAQQRADDARAGAGGVRRVTPYVKLLLIAKSALLFDADEDAAVVDELPQVHQPLAAPCRCAMSSVCAQVPMFGVSVELLPRHRSCATSACPRPRAWLPPGPKRITSYFARRFGVSRIVLRIDVVVRDRRRRRTPAATSLRSACWSSVCSSATRAARAGCVFTAGAAASACAFSPSSVVTLSRSACDTPLMTNDAAVELRARPPRTAPRRSGCRRPSAGSAA